MPETRSPEPGTRSKITAAQAHKQFRELMNLVPAGLIPKIADLAIDVHAYLDAARAAETAASSPPSHQAAKTPEFMH